MHIKSVVSHLGGWQRLTEQHAQEYQELVHILGDLNLDKKFNNQLPFEIRQQKYSPSENKRQNLYQVRLVDDWLDKRFAASGWHPEDINRRLFLGQKNNTLYRYTELDALKHGVGVDVTFSKYAFAESCIFVKFPIFFQAQRIDLGVLIVPMDETRKLFQPGTSGFEMLDDRLKALAFMPIKYPLVILGITHLPIEEIKVKELTSPLDNYLVQFTGLTLSEMKLKTERPNYDFKLEVPENQTLAKEICAFTNFPGGGLLLVGVNNDGDPIGVLRDNLDTLQNRILQVNRNNVSPNPEIGFEVFELQSENDRCILIVKIQEFARKPCMFQERVYIRSGPEARPAKAHEIRKMILGDE
jgi:hypothetical protein